MNLMSSIKKALGGKSDYDPLRNFDISRLKNKNIVLLIIDGLGYEFLKKYGKGTIFEKNLERSMTSVFPSTTASATVTLTVGDAPQQHALTGWFMYLKEIGMVATILPFLSRSGNFSLGKNNIKFKDIFKQESFFKRLKAKSFILRHKDYAFSDFNKATSRGAKIVPFKSIDELLKEINKIVTSEKGKKFVNAYWGELDSLSHRFGTDAKKTINHLKSLDKKIKSFLHSAKNSNTVVIITSDHGQIDTKDKEKIIKLEKHPKLYECLTLPLCGEPRAAYCYVKPSKAKQFEKYVKSELGHACLLYKSADLLKKNYFGLFSPNEKLKDRIGDYVIIMKDDYIIRDKLLGEKVDYYIGNHGGMSKEEMLVPLVVINC